MDILKFVDFISESINDNFVYRYISVKFFMEICDKNIMPPSLITMHQDLQANNKYKKYNYFISVTRDKNFVFDYTSKIKLTFDKNKLKEKYKIVPIDWFYMIDDKFKHKHKRTESEERILFKNNIGIKNWKDYLIDIDYIKPPYYIQNHIPDEVLIKIKEIHDSIK